jgi:hypothetical protein
VHFFIIMKSNDVLNKTQGKARIMAVDTAGGADIVRFVRVRAVALAGISSCLAVLVAVRIMSFELRKDEQLYVPPAQLLEHMSLYRDFFYNHPPASAWYFRAIFVFLGSDHLLLSGRLGMVFAWLFFAGALFAVSYVLTRSASVSWSIAILTLFNDLFLGQTGMAATNNFIPLSLSFLGISLFVIALRGPEPRSMLVLFAGMALSFAVSVKISAIAFVPPVAIAAVLLPRTAVVRERIVRVLAPLAAGGLIGGIPILVNVMTRPSLFFAHILRYHAGPHLRYFREGMSEEGSALSVADKMALASQTWLSASCAVGLTALLVLGALAFQSRDQRTITRMAATTPLMTVVCGALIVSVPMSFLPTPSFEQYFAPPIICLPLLLALLYAALPRSRQIQARTVLLACAFAALAATAPRLAPAIPKLFQPHRWSVFTVHEAGLRIADILEAEKSAGPVVTLAPVYPLEAKLDIYQEFATGPFVYRTGDVTDADLASYYKMTSPSLVGALLESRPPAALLLGADDRLEAPMKAFAGEHGYRLVEDFEIRDRQGTLRLYIRPAQ